MSFVVSGVGLSRYRSSKRDYKMRWLKHRTGLQIQPAQSNLTPPYGLRNRHVRSPTVSLVVFVWCEVGFETGRTTQAAMEELVKQVIAVDAEQLQLAN